MNGKPFNQSHEEPINTPKTNTFSIPCDHFASETLASKSVISKNPSKPLISMARPIKKEEEAKKKPVVVEVKTLEKPAPPPPTPAPQRPFSLAPVANAFDLLDEDSSDLISIVDAKKDDAFVAAERKRIEEEKKAVREAKMKARVEEMKAKKRAIQEQERKKKAYEASILGFHGHSARPSPSFSRGPTGGIPKPSNDGLQPQLAQSSSALELQVKESRGAVVEEEAASVDGSSSKSSGGSRRPNVNGSLRRKQKKKKKAASGEKKEGEDQQGGNIAAAAVAAPVGNNNYPRSYTLKEYEERKKREEDEKDKKFNAINNGMDHRPRRFDNEGQRFDGRRFDNGGQKRFDKQQAPEEKALVQSDASFSLEDAEFPVLAKQAAAVKALAEKAVVEKAPARKAVAKKASAQKA